MTNSEVLEGNESESRRNSVSTVAKKLPTSLGIYEGQAGGQRKGVHTV